MNTFSRSALLGATFAIALVGLPLMTTFVEAAEKADPGDIATLNAAIELERAGTKAYVDAAATGILPKEILAIASGFAADHTAHRDALIAAVKASGTTPSTKTAAIAYPPLKTTNDILAFAMVVERKAASTYLSVIPDLKDPAFRQAAASILGVETTHVALLAQALGTGPAYKSGFTA